jgi:hypothetical protein
MHSGTSIVTNIKISPGPPYVRFGRPLLHAVRKNKNGEAKQRWMKEGIKFLSYVNVASGKHNIGIGEYYFCFNSPNAPSGRLVMRRNQKGKANKRSEKQSVLKDIA